MFSNTVVHSTGTKLNIGDSSVVRCTMIDPVVNVESEIGWTWSILRRTRHSKTTNTVKNLKSSLFRHKCERTAQNDAFQKMIV